LTVLVPPAPPSIVPMMFDPVRMLSVLLPPPMSIASPFAPEIVPELVITLLKLPTSLMPKPLRPWIVPALVMVVGPTAGPPEPLSTRIAWLAPLMSAPAALWIVPPPIAMPSLAFGSPPRSTPPAPVPSMMPKFLILPIRSMSTPSPSPFPVPEKAPVIRP